MGTRRCTGGELGGGDHVLDLHRPRAARQAYERSLGAVPLAVEQRHPRTDAEAADAHVMQHPFP